MKSTAKKMNDTPLNVSTPLEKPIPLRFKKANTLPQIKKEITRKVAVPDIVVTMLQNAIDDSGMDAVKIAVETHISWRTVNNIIIGKTSRPQNYTCEKIFSACGFERLLRKKAG